MGSEKIGGKGSEMLETSHERVKLLKAGYDLKKIEEIYISDHNLKIIMKPNFFELIELDL